MGEVGYLDIPVTEAVCGKRFGIFVRVEVYDEI